MPSLPHTIHGVIQEFSDDSAVIKLDNGETVRLPKHLTSESANTGSGVHLAVFSDADVAAEHERLAKKVLAELLRGE